MAVSHTGQIPGEPLGPKLLWPGLHQSSDAHALDYFLVAPVSAIFNCTRILRIFFSFRAAKNTEEALTERRGTQLGKYYREGALL